ncbi:MAG TPA: PEP/pyruvate-binding domain-containing protein [Candidatus Limnocylindria bacterium]|nr:PEP/pyruvate-binding domain-containing protein [Candidatus Limnocylindria bacterium]
MFIKTFKQLSNKDVAIAGGKGASLGEMTQAGMVVPPGFVVLAGAFDRFLEETEIDADIEAILKKANHKDINSVDKASEEIRVLIMEEKMPDDLQKAVLAEYKKLKAAFVAVRSSATAEDSKAASWAGELETYLNVREKQLINSIIKCWASLFTPRAIFYRVEKKMHKQKVSVAVVVQKMVQSQVSGICFTVHPVTKDRNQMVIEAGFGLGEAIVGGLVTPDTYVVHKNDFSILDITTSTQNFAIIKSAKGNTHKKLSEKEGSKQKLTGKQIVEFAKLAKNIEKHYKTPQDIEWALEKNKFYILQSRPITTL